VVGAGVNVAFRHPLDEVPGVKHLLDLVRLRGLAVLQRERNWVFRPSSGCWRELSRDHGPERLGQLGRSKCTGTEAEPSSHRDSDLLPLWSDGRYFPLYVFPQSSSDALDRQTRDRTWMGNETVGAGSNAPARVLRSTFSHQHV
jgi:hypothetical protein